jgi:hypothetical protein
MNNEKSVKIFGNSIKTGIIQAISFFVKLHQNYECEIENFTKNFKGLASSLTRDTVIGNSITNCVS